MDMDGDAALDIDIHKKVNKKENEAKRGNS